MGKESSFKDALEAMESLVYFMSARTTRNVLRDLWKRSPRKYNKLLVNYAFNGIDIACACREGMYPNTAPELCYPKVVAAIGTLMGFLERGTLGNLISEFHGQFTPKRWIEFCRLVAQNFADDITTRGKLGTRRKITVETFEHCLSYCKAYAQERARNVSEKNPKAQFAKKTLESVIASRAWRRLGRDKRVELLENYVKFPGNLKGDASLEAAREALNKLQVTHEMAAA